MVNVRGKFITFEGGEGCGKSTHVKLLAERLRATGIELVTVREPGGTLAGEAIRDILKKVTQEPLTDRCELLLFLAARAQLVNRVILPALARGAWVLSDRFSDSTFAYQGYGRGLPLEILRTVNAFAAEELKPDLTILLTIDKNTAAGRLAERGETDRIELAGDEFHQRLARGFAEMAKAEPERFVVIPTDGPCDKTAETIWKSVTHIL